MIRGFYQWSTSLQKSQESITPQHVSHKQPLLHPSWIKAPSTHFSHRLNQNKHTTDTITTAAHQSNQQSHRCTCLVTYWRYVRPLSAPYFIHVPSKFQTHLLSIQAQAQCTSPQRVRGRPPQLTEVIDNYNTAHVSKPTGAMSDCHQLTRSLQTQTRRSPIQAQAQYASHLSRCKERRGHVPLGLTCAGTLTIQTITRVSTHHPTFYRIGSYRHCANILLFDPLVGHGEIFPISVIPRGAERLDGQLLKGGDYSMMMSMTSAICIVLGRLSLRHMS